MFRMGGMRIYFAFCPILVGVGFQRPLAVQAQSIQALAPIQLAQAGPAFPSLYPTDVTPTPINRERALLVPYRTYYFYKYLPSRLWFNLSTEVSQRYESNVFLTRNNGRSDYVYRTLPNITLGYNILKRTSIYTNYFVLKDLFAGRERLSFPTTQSLSLGLRHEIPINSRTVLQFDFQARELWQTTHLHQADLIPGVTITRTLSPRSILFANALLQMRGANYFVAPTRELDPFVTLGYLYSRGAWVFSAVGTAVFNVRHPTFDFSVPDAGNKSIIADFEISHPVSSKFPGLVAFLRAEPIWNWASRGVPGISGYDFRLFSGLRFTMVKPAYSTSINKLKRQLQQSKAEPNPPLSSISPSYSTNGTEPISPKSLVSTKAPVDNPAPDASDNRGLDGTIKTMPALEANVDIPLHGPIDARNVLPAAIAAP